MRTTTGDDLKVTLGGPDCPVCADQVEEDLDRLDRAAARLRLMKASDGLFFCLNDWYGYASAHFETVELEDIDLAARLNDEHGWRGVYALIDERNEAWPLKLHRKREYLKVRRAVREALKNEQDKGE
jgi:hypothetical protein